MNNLLRMDSDETESRKKTIAYEPIRRSSAITAMSNIGKCIQAEKTGEDSLEEDDEDENTSSSDNSTPDLKIPNLPPPSCTARQLLEKKDLAGLYYKLKQCAMCHEVFTKSTMTRQHLHVAHSMKRCWYCFRATASDKFDDHFKQHADSTGRVKCFIENCTFSKHYSDYIYISQHIGRHLAHAANQAANKREVVQKRRLDKNETQNSQSESISTPLPLYYSTTGKIEYNRSTASPSPLHSVGSSTSTEVFYNTNGTEETEDDEHEEEEVGDDQPPLDLDELDEDIQNCVNDEEDNNKVQSENGEPKPKRRCVRAGTCLIKGMEYDFYQIYTDSDDDQDPDGSFPSKIVAIKKKPHQLNISQNGQK